MAKKYKLWISLFLVTPATVHPTHSCSIIRAVGILSLKQYFHQILQQWLLSEEIWTPKYNAQGPLLQLHSYISPLFPLILVTLWDWVFIYIYMYCNICSSSFSSFSSSSSSPFTQITSLTLKCLISNLLYLTLFSHQPLRILVLNSYSLNLFSV